MTQLEDMPETGITPGGTTGAFRDVLAKDHARRGKPPVHFADMTPEERIARAGELGLPKFRIKQLANHYYGHFDVNAAEFTDQVYDDIRNMVRRDRNRPSVWLWEPILNETGYPDDFARRAVELVREEYPYPSCYMACDATARGNEYFPVLFAHPTLGGDGFSEIPPMRKGIAYFTREWGDNVDDWSSHNSPSRASRAWGEVPMLVQAKSYGKPDYRYTCYDVLWRMPAQHVGGCLWHAFDHQRGYHPDPFYGGLMDAFRQPKLSYELFRAQRPPRVNDALPAETGPMVFIAHAMTPFSPADVTVFSNCEEVRLTCGKDGPVRVCRQPADSAGMPSPAFVFPDVFNVMDDKRLSRSRRQADSYLLAEGLIGGKVVATHKVMPARRPGHPVRPACRFPRKIPCSRFRRPGFPPVRFLFL